MMRYSCRAGIGVLVGIVVSLAVAGCGGGGGGGVDLGVAPASVRGTVVGVACGGGGGGGGGGPTPGGDPASVRGAVVDDATGQPVSGARIRSGGRSARAAADGTFTLGVEVGAVSITVSATDYHPLTYT